MKYNVIDISSKVVGSIELEDMIFNHEKMSEACVYEAIKNILANKRQGTASTKTRSEIRGSTRKPWKQKGTGRARVGNAKSPLWRGKGIIFGPSPNNYSYKIPKKIKRKAYYTVFTSLAKEGELKVIEDFKMKSHKTKEFMSIFAKITNGQRVMFITDNSNEENYKQLYISSKNIPWVKMVNVDSIEIKDLFYAKEVVIGKSSIDIINKRYKNS